MLVPVLPTCPGPGIPLDFEVALIERNGLHGKRINHRDSNRGCVNAALAFGWRDTLDAMASGLLLQL